MERHVCFLSITRPVMRAYVTVPFLGINIFGHLVLMVMTKWYFLCIASGLLCHGVGALVLSVDPRFIDLFLGKLKCCRIENRIFWGCNSYEPY